MAAGKEHISIRIDTGILAWFRKASPKGYQSRIQQVLTEYVDAARRAEERKTGRAQELFRQYYAQCFWHYDPNLEVNSDNLELVVEGLRKYGGRKGLQLSEEICR